MTRVQFSRRLVVSCVRTAIALLAMALVLASSANPAAAHTGFESSIPADGAVVVEPVTEIVITFSGPSEPVGEGFVILLPTGEVVEPTEVTLVDEVSWVLRLPETLMAGVVGVRWQVQAPDAHPIDGSFSFTVAVPAAASAATEESTVVPRALAGGRCRRPPWWWPLRWASSAASSASGEPSSCLGWRCSPPPS